MQLLVQHTPSVEIASHHLTVAIRDACILIKLLFRTRVALATGSYQRLVLDVHVRHGEVVLWGFSACGKGITSQRHVGSAYMWPLLGLPWLAGMSAVSEQAPPGYLLGDYQAPSF